MISDTSECPAWIRELIRFTPLKNLIFVYGNTYDRVSYPVSSPNGTSVNWTESELSTFFVRYLGSRGYEVIGLFDPVDGLTFAHPDMKKIYNKLHKSNSGTTPSPSSIPGGRIQEAPRGATGANASPDKEDQETDQPHQAGNRDPIKAIEGIRAAMTNTVVPCAFVFNLASRLTASPTLLEEKEKDFFSRMLKASLTAKSVVRQDTVLNNVIILVCEKLNDLPAFLYISNPRARSIHLPKPDTRARTRFIERSYKAFYTLPNAPDIELTPELTGYFAALTEGLTNYEMSSLVNLSRIEKEPLQHIRKICERYKYGITESEWDKIGKDRLAMAEDKIRERVKGQDAAVHTVLDTIKRARTGLAAGGHGKAGRPRGVLFFAGPTGVGKTEMAKTMAELLFGLEERCLRFDMSEYSAPQSDQRLLGAPPGYVGYEEGGQLTKAVRENPFSILLFDEIEKAHGSIFDKFLQILDDGRLTDGKGETVYFSECIIIFTSNLGTVNENAAGQSAVITSEMPYPTLRDNILKGIYRHFNTTLKRPEILNRIGDNFVVFDFIRPPLDEEILTMLISQLQKSAQDNKGITLEISPAVFTTLLKETKHHLNHGGRGIRNALDKTLINPLNRTMFDQGIERGTTLKIKQIVDHGDTSARRFQLDVEIC